MTPRNGRGLDAHPHLSSALPALSLPGGLRAPVMIVLAALPKALAGLGAGVVLAAVEAGTSPEVIILALIAATPPTIVALVTLVIGVLNTRAAKQAVSKVEKLQISIDGRMTRLLELTERSALAEGELAGLDKGAALAETAATTLAAAVAAPAVPAATGTPTEVKVVQDPGDAAVRVKGDKPK